jgi:Zn-finger nucleic acid-binding protein
MPWVKASLRCPHCGGKTSANAARCAHCNKRVKTIGMPSPEGAASRSSAREKPVRCPGCGTTTDFAYLSTMQIDACASCGGVWFDRQELADLPARLSDYDLAQGAAEAFSALGDCSLKPQSARRLSCPICSGPLLRRVYRDASGIMTDHCERCGTWVSGPSMSRILEIIVSGDLPEIDRRAEEKHEAEEARRRRDALRVPALPAPPDGMAPQNEYEARTVGLALDLAGFLLRLLV